MADRSAASARKAITVRERGRGYANTRMSAKAVRTAPNTMRKRLSAEKRCSFIYSKDYTEDSNDGLHGFILLVFVAAVWPRLRYEAVIDGVPVEGVGCVEASSIALLDHARR